MSNIEAAIAALSAERDLAIQGRDHYARLIQSLEVSLQQLAGIEGGQAAPAKRKAGRPRKGEQAVAPEAPKPAQKKKAKSKELPSTGGDFWISLIGKTGKTAPEVMQAAFEKMGIAPNADQKKKLSNRMVFALNSLTKSGAISDSGKGRERRFFKE